MFSELAKAGATGVTAGALYLKPGTREWYMQWLAAQHPELVGKYRSLYGQGSDVSKEYSTWLTGRITHFKSRHGFSGSHGFSHRDLAQDPRDEEAQYPAGSMPEAGTGPGRTTGHRGAAATAGGAGHAAGADSTQPTLF